MRTTPLGCALYIAPDPTKQDHLTAVHSGGLDMVNFPRHRWSLPNRPSALRTERTCVKCGIVRVSRHDGEGIVDGVPCYPWTEFLDQAGNLIDVGGGSGPTPPCEPRAGREAA